MPYNADTIKITWGFAVASEREIAQTGLRISGGPGWASEDTFTAITDANLASLAAAYASFIAALSPDALWANYSSLVSVKAARVNPAGHYYEDPKVHAVTGVSGSDPAVYPQLSVCLSLRSGFHTGEANYGRMFLPHTRLAIITGTPRSSFAHSNNVAAEAVDFLHAVNDLFADLPHSPVVAIMSSKGAGATKLVAHVEVGDVTDTIGERKEQLKPIYASQAL